MHVLLLQDSRYLFNTRTLYTAGHNSSLQGRSSFTQLSICNIQIIKGLPSHHCLQKQSIFLLNSPQRSQELSKSDFSGSSHGQQEAEERQGPMPIVPTHYQPGVVFLSSVPRAHIGHTTHKSMFVGLVSPSKVQDGIKHQLAASI